VTSIAVSSSTIPTTYNYKLAISTGTISYPCPTYVISPDPTGCPPLAYEMILAPDSKDIWDISKFLLDTTPEFTTGW